MFVNTLKRWTKLIPVLGALTAFSSLIFGPGRATAGEPPLATLQYKIVGTQLRVSPSVLSVPKGIPGSVLVEMANADGSVSAATNLIQGAHIEAVFRGPAFEARRLVGQPNAPLMLPPLNLVGDYQLDNIRLVDSVTGDTRMEATPSSVPVRVFDEVLVSRVTSRPLTYEEIQDKGIVIDQNNFRAVEFEVGFVIDGKTIPVKFPVVSPTFHQSTEIIPREELEARLLEAQIINEQIASTTELPPELETTQLNIQVQGINFQEVELGEQDLTLQIPPIPAVMIIPGNIGFLNQFFSVQIFTENAAPANSGLSVVNVQAELILPPGNDRIASTNYSEPGDDPLRFARIGPEQVIENIQPVVRPGVDGELGTADDIPRIFPNEQGRGEFFVEGLKEGLHLMDLKLTAELEGLAAGIVKIQGRAAGSVLVRNPKFSMAFSHPRTIRAGEPYDAFVTVLNTSPSPANLVSVTLPATALSGGVLETNQPETVQLNTILPGQTATAKFRIRAQTTGSITFSDLTTSDDSVVGRFRLRMGIDERGIALSPDTIGMPEYVNALPNSLLFAANRVLGQALSVSTAALLPATIKPVAKSTITRRVLELAEAGQRLRYGDSLKAVLADLLVDWQGGRLFQEGFDQIIRETDAGREFRDALMHAIENADALDASARIEERAADLAGRGEAWFFAGTDSSEVEVSLLAEGKAVALDRSELTRSAGYRGERGHWLVSTPKTNGTLKWQVLTNINAANLAVLALTTNGSGQLFKWEIGPATGGSCFSFVLGDGTGTLLSDTNCDGTIDASIAASSLAAVNEKPPEVLAVLQDMLVPAGRPQPHCLNGAGENYGTIVAVLFSKAMTQSTVNVPTAYQLDNGTTAGSVQIQPGGRVALLNLRHPVSAIRPRTLTVSGIADVRGNAVVNSSSLEIQTTLTSGVALRGRVARADGSPAAGIPVTLTMYDLRLDTGFSSSCEAFVVRVCQVSTDSNGYFEIDYVMSGVPYSVSATDIGNLPQSAIDLIMQASSADAVMRDRLLALASSPSVQNTLLGAFALSSVPEAIAAAEGLDRALLRDSIDVGSPREGTIVPVALRFRGRGTVTGQVLASDGATPVANVAVNLFPDPDSREQGRGVFSDSNGRFAFAGVPLGTFSIQAQSPSGQFRTVSDVIDEVGETKEMAIILSSTVTPLADLRGRVTETDNVTPHPGARVFVGKYNLGTFGSVVAAVTADADGYWSANGIPARTYDVVAVSLDGRRKGDRLDVVASSGAPTQITIALQSTAVVVGRVENSVGEPVTNALVAGGDIIVRTGADGLFRMTGVPTGLRTISAGLERNPAAGIDFPRFGNAALNVVSGIENYVIVRLRPAGRIVGRVLDANGNHVPNTRVALPVENGFQWVETDALGNYKFENLGLKDWDVSSPAPAAANNDTSQLLTQIRNGSEEEIEAAIGEAFAVFTGQANPYLNGEGEVFNPLTWGYARASLTFDGQTAVADIRYLRQGTIAGKVLNGQGVPIGARVRLTGIGPLLNGAPSFILRGERDSDPALGTFEFVGQALVGSWGLQAANPFYPVVISQSGQTTSVEPHATNIVLQFPPKTEVDGRLAGTVFNPDGSPVGAGVSVKISLSTNYVILTDTNGNYDTKFNLPARSYSVEAIDNSTGLRGISSVQLVAGITNVCNVRLLSKGHMQITVRQANGQPAIGATVSAAQGGYPYESGLSGTVDSNGVVSFNNIFEGNYGVSAQLVSGPTTISGRSGVQVFPGVTNSTTIYLSPTATIRGTFVKRDLVTPIAFAQVAVGTLGFATTDSGGDFQISAIPLGTYRLVSQDPVTGIGASLYVTLNVDGEVRDVQLVEQSRGEIKGLVLGSYGTNFVAGATVTLKVHDGLTPPRAVSTGPDGAFSFPGTPAGSFEIDAEDPVSHLRGSVTGTLPENTASLQLTLQIQPLARLAGTVYQPNGSVATNASVRLTGLKTANSDTDAAGRVVFADLPLGTYGLRATSLALTETRSVAVTNISLSTPGDAPDFVLHLLGVGSVTGRVYQSDGVTASAGAAVHLSVQSSLVSDEVDKLADAEGYFSFDNIAIGPYRLTATAQALGASFSGLISSNGQRDQVDLTLGASGVVTGRLVRTDGATGVTNVDVLLTFNSQSGLPGRATVRSGANGGFQFENVPVGVFNLESIAADFGGIAKATATLSTNGETIDLGNVRLDEEDPRVISVVPMHTSVNVPINTTIDLLFNEAMALSSLNPGGIYLRTGTNTIPATVQLLATNSVPRLVRLIPSAALQSEVTYEIVVIDGERKGPTGIVIATGPTDLVGRPLTAPFISRFTTADQDPPDLVSISPTNGAMQIDTRASVRLSFNESIRDSNFTFTVMGAGGPVAGTASVGLNGLVLAFTPTAALEVNATYTAFISNVVDLAGNVAVGQPFVTTFRTLDTLGPSISTLKIAENKPPVAGGRVHIEATLATNEAGASVRITQDFVPIGVALNLPYRVEATLPTNGSVTFRAIALDVYGNEGPVSEMTVAVVSNQPPVLQLARTNPVSGPVGNNQTFALLVGGTDDLDVTNLTVAITGALNLITNFPDGQQRILQFTVPPTAPAGSQIEVRAQATDSLGAHSSELSLNFNVIDRIAPEVGFVSPAPNLLLDTAQPLNITVTSFDNSTNYQLQLVLSGGLALTQTVAVAAANQTVSNVFTFSLANASTIGTNLIATLRATDNDTNVSIIGRTFVLPDTHPPEISSAIPSNGAVRQSLWLQSIDLQFDGALLASTVSTNTVLFTNNAGLAVPFTVGLEPDSRTIRVEPSVLPLAPGVVYTNRVLAGIKDVSSNVLGAELSFAFATASILAVTPTNGAPIVPGQLIKPSVTFEQGLGASYFRFVLESNTPVEVAVASVATNVLGNVRLATNATEAHLTISAGTNSLPLHVLPAIAMNVRPRSGDDDGDGWGNGFEADRDMNPFVLNPDSEDFDGDGLTNGQERSLGTDPGNTDSDGDTLTDGTEVLVMGTNPLNRDTDGDNVDDNIDTQPVDNLARPPAVDPISPFEIVQGSVTNILISGRDPDFNLRTLRISALSGGTNWSILRWTNSASANYTVSSNVFVLTGTLELLNTFASTSQLEIIAVDVDTLTATQVVEVVVLADMDLDGTPDRSDSDVDGDGLSNEQEGILGTSPFNPDSDSDSIPDGVDPFPVVRNVKPVAGNLSNGHALFFDGSNDYVEFADSASLRLNPNFTIEYWFKAASVGTGAIIGKELGTSYDDSYAAWFSSSGTISFYAFNSPQLNHSGISPGRWYHFAAVKSGSTMQMYVDGNLVAQTTSATATTSYDNHPVYLGGDDNDNNGVPDLMYNGIIDEFRVWNVALAPQEFYAANFRTNITSTAVNAFWSLDEGAGTSVTDGTTNANHGILGTNIVQPTWTNGLDAFSILTVTGGVPHVVFDIDGSDPEGQPLTALIRTLPAAGRLHQTLDGVTLGARITNALTQVSNSLFKVMYVPPRGISTNVEFIYQTSDGYLLSGDGLVRLNIVVDPAADTDGDGLTDVYEVARGMNPEVHDSSLDFDGDGLSNLNEFLQNTDPATPDTDSDGLKDGQEFLVGSNPLVRDTDGDGIPDGEDPFPTTVIDGLPAEPVPTITVTEGQSTNIAIQFTSVEAPIVLMDYTPTNLPPAFVSLPSIEFTNTGSNWMAIGQLTLNPLHDAAGTYTISIRAAAGNGVSGVINVNVTVVDALALTETRWIDPVSGNWSDPARWSAGVPTSNNVAVIDVPGTYSVTLNVGFDAAGLVLNHSNATLFIPQSRTFNAPVENRQGTILINTGDFVTLTINRSFYNGGNLRLVGNWYNSTLIGSGWIENPGLIYMAVGVGGYSGTESVIRLPLNIPAAGRLTLNTSGSINLASGALLRVAGKVEVQSGARLRAENSAPVRDILLLAGGEILGDGVLELNGSNRLVPIGDAIAVVKIRLFDSSSVAGPGRLILYGNQLLSGGTYSSRLRIANGSVVELRHITIAGDTEIEPGALVYFQPSGDYYNLTLNAPMTNRGTFRMVGNWYRSLVTGSGRIENEGLMDMTVGHGGYSGTESLIHVPLHVASAGRLLLNTQGYLNIQNNGGLLTVAGTVEIQNGARLRFEDSTALRDTTFLPGSQLLGSGTIQFDNNNQMIVAGALNPGPHIALNGNSKASGEGKFLFTGNRNLAGNYQLPMQFASNSVAELRHCTFGSNVVVDTGSLVYFYHSSDYYNLTLDGLLTNRGTWRMVGNWYRSLVQGSGRFENEGLIDMTVGLGGYSGTESLFRVPVHVAPAGRLLLNTQGYMNFQNNGGSLTVAGVVEIQNGARLRFEDSSVVRDTVFLPGSQLVGNGTIQFDNNNQMIVSGNLTAGPHIALSGSGKVTGEGRLIHGGNRLLSGNYAVQMQFLTNCVAELRHATFGSNSVIDPGALVFFTATGDYYNLTLNAALTNRGGFRMVGNWYRSQVGGSGFIENEGLMDMSVGVGGYVDAEAYVRVPVNITSAGRLVANTNGYINFQDGGGLLTVSGVVEIQPGGRIRFESSTGLRDATFLPGGQLLGSGTFQLDNNNRLVVTDDLIPQPRVFLNGNSQAVGPGRLLFGGNHLLLGDYQTRVQFLTNGVFDLRDCTFGSNVVIDAGALVYIQPSGNSYTVNINSDFTNNGTFRMVGNWYVSTVRGSGRIENAGVIDMNVGVGGYSSGEAAVRLPITTSVAGQFVVNTNGYIYFGTGGSLAVSGILDVQSGGRLRFAEGSPVNLTLNSGATIAGNGTTQIESTDTLIVNGNATLAGGLLALINSSTATGSGTLTVNPGATLRMDHAVSFPGSITVGGTLTYVSGTSQILGTLNLLAAGTLNNPVVLQVGEFVPGGTVIGNAPQVIGTGSRMKFTSITFAQGPAGGGSALGDSTQKRIVLAWEGPAKKWCEIEYSSDLVAWRKASVAVTEVSAGRYKAELPVEMGNFFRLKMAP